MEGFMTRLVRHCTYVHNLVVYRFCEIEFREFVLLPLFRISFIVDDLDV